MDLNYSATDKACCRQVKARDQSANCIADLVNENDKVIVARGGNGGRGNISFGTKNWGPASTWSEQGGSGEDVYLLLEIKLVADVALVGFPNVGKSSLLRAITRAEPKVADYAFTTLEPQLGRLHGIEEGTDITIADMPGLVEDAHADRGLGHDFLRCGLSLDFFSSFPQRTCSYIRGKN